MTDIANHGTETQRELGMRQTTEGDARYLVIRRHYNAPVAEVWDACTDPERISRWLLPISGDLRLGGTYQLEGNAGGKILRCEPPHLLVLTWVFGEPQPGESSVVEVRLSPESDGRTFLELDHAAIFDMPHDIWLANIGDFGAGWETVTTALANHLESGGQDSQPAEHDASPGPIWTALAKQSLDRSTN